jgi:hypothetical protein
VITIERGFPAPEGSVLGRSRKYPFRDMSVGDSFFVELPVRNESPEFTEDRLQRLLNTVRNSSNYCAKNTGMQFVSRIQVNVATSLVHHPCEQQPRKISRDTVGVRCWRTK